MSRAPAASDDVERLRRQVNGELARLQRVVVEVESLRSDVQDRTPTIRERVAAGGFLAQFYNGVENVLKRIARFHGVRLPEGERWHAELLALFESKQADGADRDPLSGLIDADLADELRRYLGFRHVVRSSYGDDLDWSLMEEGIDRIGETFRRFEKAVAALIHG